MHETVVSAKHMHDCCGVRAAHCAYGNAGIMRSNEARVAIINRRTCDRAIVGSAPTIAWYEVRDTKGNRRARNRLRLGSTVGGYPVAIRTLRQLVLARSGVTGLELDNQPGSVQSVDAKSHSRWLLGNDL
jgi:hypothetical protein